MAAHLKSATEYTRKYSDFLGVDLSSSGRNSDRRRFSYAQNMYKDYDIDGQTIESVPGYRSILSMAGYKINGIYTQRASDGVYMILHSGARLHRILLSDFDALTLGSSICTMPNSKSTGYAYGTDFYILDGTRIIRIDDGGNVTTVCDTERCYVPTTYYNGEKYEQRNLLSNEAIEKYDISSADSHAYGTPGLIYTVINREFGYCGVISTRSSVTGRVVIPSRVRIGNEDYKVTRIEGSAFYNNTSITEVVIGEGVEEICTSAFWGCTSLTSIKTPTSLKTLGNRCFYGCSALKDIYLGYGLTSISNNSFEGCGALSNVYYAGSVEEFDAIANSNVLAAKTKHYHSSYNGISVSFQIFSSAKSINSVKVNGTAKSFNRYYDEKGDSFIMLNFDNRADIEGASIVIEETLNTYYSDFNNHGVSLITGKNALLCCTIAEKFDGKIFFSGNPFLPNTVFYTSIDKSGRNNPLYVGEHNFFNDGVGQYTVTSLLCVRDSLAVFKSGDDGTGSIFYHAKKETGEDLIPVIYPVSYVHSGVCALSRAINFLDDPVFLTSSGLVSLQQSEFSSDRNISIRSHNVNRELLKEDLSEATLLEWQGYLCICVNGKIFLADPRAMFKHQSGNIEYEWFIINPVGFFYNDKKVFRFDTTYKEGYALHPEGEKQVTSAVYGSTVNGETVYYVMIDGVKYNVYQTEEKYAGTYNPAHTFAAYNNYLFFGGNSGGVLMFNNDKRGVPPAHISEQVGFNATEYEKMYGTRIHPSFYSFNSHAVRYCITTLYDDCDIPNLTKCTVKHSLVIKYKSYSSAKIICEIGTDTGGFEEECDFSSGGINFEDIDFSNFTTAVGDYFTIPISEKEKNWIEKQINIYSDAYNAPIGICSITYRYTIKGRIKRN